MSDRRRTRWWYGVTAGLGVAMALLWPIAAWAGTSKCDATIGAKCRLVNRIDYTCCLWTLPGGYQRTPGTKVEIYENAIHHLYVRCVTPGTPSGTCDPDPEGTCC